MIAASSGSLGRSTAPAQHAREDIARYIEFPLTQRLPLVIVITGHARPLDELTHRAILDWLDSRRTRWPNTANPHLLITQQTALETGPVGRHWVTEALRRQAATLERLRVDRQLEEALTHGPDPLHLSVVFGLDEKTAIRYAAAARQLLETHIERDTSG